MNRLVPSNRKRRARAFAILELVVAMGILTSIMLPVAFSIVKEQRLARAYYYRAVAIEIIDGEMEVLRAGEWRAYSKGPQPYSVHAEAARNLPPGKFTLTIDEAQMRLEWRPGKPGQGGPVTRVAPLAVETRLKASRR